MSAHSGMYHFDGREVRPDSLATLGRSLERHGPDGGATYSNGSLAVAYYAFHTNKESRFEKQPLFSRFGHVLTWDGRLDNREELINQLLDKLEDDHTDAAIAITAYLKWGIDCFARLIGDWALALWEPKDKSILLARDFPGNRPLYYGLRDMSVVWSSELETFLDLGRDFARLNNRYLMSFLVSYPKVNDTPYSDVVSVPPGHVASIRDGVVTLHKCWEPNLEAQIQYQDDSEYEAHFRDLFRACVRSRLRAQGVIWAELSGGLDSSSIVCIANEMLKDEGVQASDVETISYVYNHSTSADEREHIRYVEAKIGRAGYHLEETEHSLFFPTAKSPYLSRPQSGIGRSTKVARLMEQKGVRVLLSGQGGDSVMWSLSRPCLELADLLAARSLCKLHERIKAFSLHTGRTYWNLFWADAVHSLSSELIAIDNRRMGIDPWINWDLFKELKQSDTTVSTSTPQSLPVSRRVAYGFLLDTVCILSLQHFRTCGMIEATYPFLDRRLIQFMLAVPFDQKLRPENTRSLHRRAMKGILPQEIETRQTKPGAEEFVCRALNREWSAIQPLFTADARVVRHGYVDLPQLLIALDKARDGRAQDIFSLIRVISLEVWLRGLEHEGIFEVNTKVV
jgi:asparagine synthase (glutamine-hydrolysing)